MKTEYEAAKFMPCPFCGNTELEFNRYLSAGWIECSKCESQGPHSNLAEVSLEQCKSNAIVYWNSFSGSSKQNLTDVLEISEMLVGDEGSRFLDLPLLMYLAQYNSYGCKEDVEIDGKTPRRVRLQMHIYVEDLDG